MASRNQRSPSYSSGTASPPSSASYSSGTASPPPCSPQRPAAARIPRPTAAKQKPQRRAAPKQLKARVKKPKTLKRGVGALREIRKYQKSTNLLIPKLPIGRLVREIGNGKRFTPTAIEATHTAAEHYLTKVMEDANLCSIHGKRVTVQPKDIQFVIRIRQMNGRF